MRQNSLRSGWDIISSHFFLLIVTPFHWWRVHRTLILREEVGSTAAVMGSPDWTDAEAPPPGDTVDLTQMRAEPGSSEGSLLQGNHALLAPPIQDMGDCL